MDFVDLFAHGHFHKIILLSSICSSDLEYVLVCLSLAKIGRQGKAITLLRARLESARSPESKIMILKCLYKLTKIEDFATELKYLKQVSELDDRKLFIVNFALRSFEISDNKGPAKFCDDSAFVHPLSYAYTCIEDRQFARETSLTLADTPRILHAIGLGGSTINLTKAALTPETNYVFEVIEASLEAEEASLDPRAGFSEKTDFLTKTTALACYHHLSNCSEKALAYSTQALVLINHLRLTTGLSELQGISSYEKETIVMIAIQNLSETADECITENLFHELVSPAMHLDPLETRPPNMNETSGYENISRATRLRQSLFFECCGDIYRAMSDKNKKKITFKLNGREYQGVMKKREDALEAARKYAISAASQPLDTPHLRYFYDRVVWCLILAGGVDLQVIWLFLTIRSHFEHQSTFLIIEGSNELKPRSWPQSENVHDIMNKYYDMCIDALSKEKGVSRKIHISPTAAQLNDQLIIMNFYISEAQASLISEVGANDIAHSNDKEFMSKAEWFRLATTSAEVVELWSSEFHKHHGEVPLSIKQAMQWLEA